MSDTQKEILTANYWEHFKFAKELAMVYDINNPKRKLIEFTVDDIQKSLQTKTNL